MRRLEVVGPFRGASGYDRHTREFVRQFVGAGVKVQLTPLTGWSTELPVAMRETWFDGLSAPVRADTVLHFTMPNQARPRAGKRNVNYTMFEGDRIPAEWAASAVAHDRIVVPTESSFRAWAASGVPEHRLRVCPLGVDGEFFSQRTEPLPLTGPGGRPVSSYRYRFLNVADLRPRKNHLGLLRTWIRATTIHDDAILIVKLAVNSPHALDRFQADLTSMQTELGRSLQQAAPVTLIAALLDDEQLRSLLNTATHYISMSKGEGWDLVMMEAGVAGLHLIAPNHSGYTAYLRSDEAALIPATRVPAVFEGKIAPEDRVLFDGASWWQPDEDAAAAIIQRIIKGNASSERPPGERFRAKYSWGNAARRLLELLEEARHA
jgi:glycosyltransferase involved in cell wall biosynthesis